MRILVFSWRDPKHPLAGGAEQVMHEHMKGWANAGHDVTLFASRFKYSSQEEIIDGVVIKRKGYQYLGVQLAAFIYYLRNGGVYDIVIDQFHGIPFFTPLYVRKPRLAVIQETTGNVWFLNPLPFPLNWIIGLVGYIFEPLVYQLYRGTHFVTGSASCKHELIRYGIGVKNIRIVPHGVIITKSKKKIGKEKVPTITYLGLLSKDKGIEDAIRVFEILANQRDRNGPCQFWVIGKPETQSYGNIIQRQVETVGLKDRVKFWGFVSQAKKFELLARSHILINPSAREGWGLVNIEANSMAVPVVAYPSLGLIDSVKNGVSGVIIKDANPNVMAEVVSGLLRNSEKLSVLSAGAVTWSKNFTWEKSRELSLRVIESLGKQ